MREHKMKNLCFTVSVLFSFFVLHCLCADNITTSDYPELQPDWPYCFEFTWFGPDYDNVTRYNGTCADYLDETRADGVPCAAPIVISYDGTLPNMEYLWDNYKPNILCKRSVNQRCIKYTYYFNGKINNITYTCAKVQHNNGGMINSGCYKQKLTQGYDTEVCVCKSTNGIYPPCNRADILSEASNLLVTVVACLLVKFFV